MLDERIAGFVSASRAEDAEGEFQRLALERFRECWTADEAYRQAARSAGASLERTTRWDELPALDLGSATPLSKMGDLRRAAWRAVEPVPVPGPVLAESASAGAILERSLPEGSRVEPALSLAIGRSWLATRQRDRRPVSIVTSAEGLRALLDGLRRQDLRFRLPPASRIVALDGEPSRGSVDTLVEAASEYLHAPQQSLWLELRLAQHSTSLFGVPDPEGLVLVPRLPHWVRLRELDGDGEKGRSVPLAVCDLAVPGPSFCSRTAWRGVIDDRAVRLTERVEPSPS